MNLRFLLIFCLFYTLGNFSQKKLKDTVKTEVVEIITTFNPKIADAKKISNEPDLKLSKKIAKKTLNYTIFSVPVASTFIPQSGKIKPIKTNLKESFYKNYVAAGYGNYNSPFLEFLVSKQKNKDNFGIYGKYLASYSSLQNTQLKSTFSNLNLDAFYKKETRYYNWKINAVTEINKYNWYGLPLLNFSDNVINNIKPTQNYNHIKLNGIVNFNKSFIDFIDLTASSFTDRFNSKEFKIDLNGKLSYTLKKLFKFLKTDNDISLNTNLEYLSGNFETNYMNTDQIDYNFFTINFTPTYNYSNKIFTIDSSLKIMYSSDIESKVNNFFILPNIHLNSKIYKQYINLYGGFKSNLFTNTYQNFANNNPFVSPTLFITQTLEKSNIYIGFNGNITNKISYNLKFTQKQEEDKPLFLRNNSKSNGVEFATDQRELFGYEYGNSFEVFYDDIDTTTFFGELAIQITKELSLNGQLTFNNFTLNKAASPWNLPSFEGLLSLNYKQNKWFVNSNLLYVGERTDVLYNGTFPSSFRDTQTLDSFIDINLNGGYKINRKFSTFLNINNILNNQYQRFANFNVQGFQILAGITYKFDL